MSIRVAVVHGGRRFGRVWSYRGTYVQTYFFHIWFIPLIPIGGVMSKPTEVAGLDERHATNVRLTSVLVAYLRFWPLVGCLALVVQSFGGWDWDASVGRGISVVAAALAAIGLSYALGARVPDDHRLAMDLWLDEGTLPEAATE